MDSLAVSEIVAVNLELEKALLLPLLPLMEGVVPVVLQTGIASRRAVLN